MTNIELATNAIAIIIVISGFLLIYRGINAVIDELFYRVTGHQFRKDLIASIGLSKPTWMQVCEIADTRRVSERHVNQVVMALLRDVLTGLESDDESGSKRVILESYIDAYRRSQPFEGIPSDTRISLERLRADLGTKSDSLHPLTVNIRELLKIHEKVNRRQRIYTAGGCFVGVIGLVLSAYALVFPGTPSGLAVATTEAPVSSLFTAQDDGK